MRDKIRIKFEKTGMMKFVGHLDVMRYFQKAMRRAHIDIAYSEGFSPHQKMSFAAPLGIGLVGTGEYFDIEVNSLMSSQAMADALNEVMVEGFKVISCRRLPENVPNAMSSVFAADYIVTVHGDNMREHNEPSGCCKADIWRMCANHDETQCNHGIKMAPQELSAKMLEFYNQAEIITEKETKKSTRTLDLKPLIYSLTSENGVTRMCLSTGSVDNIKPELVMQKFCEYAGIEYTEDPILFDYERSEVYTNIGTDKTELVALEDMGEIIE